MRDAMLGLREWVTTEQVFAIMGCAKSEPAQVELPGSWPNLLGRSDMNDSSTRRGPNPSGLCKCGCGRPTNLAAQTNARFGHIKGEPVSFIHNHHARKSPVDYVVDAATGCWAWRGSLDPSGYGRMKIDGRSRLAHRDFYERYVGPIPAGLQIDHLCRNRACVNPAHLEPVTHTENVRRGALAKLTPAGVAAIRLLLGSVGRGDLALRFGVSRSAISDIAVGRSWR